MKSPFKFLDAFTIKDRSSFFGRDREIDTLYQMVFKSPLVLVYGLSGTGKTSLIQCGLASRFDGPEWFPLFIRRKDNINDSVMASLHQVLPDATFSSLKDGVSQILDKYYRPVYLLFDQFEELFILGTESEQHKFIENLQALLQANLGCKVLLIMREEFIGSLYPFEDIIPSLFDFRFRVEQMNANKVKDVIKSSFNAFNMSLDEPEEELLQLMVENVSDERLGITLPYLQVYLDSLYRQDFQRTYPGEVPDEKYPALTITKDELQSFGNIEDVLERFLIQQSQDIQKMMKNQFPKLPDDIVQKILDGFVSEEGTKRPIKYNLVNEEVILEPNDQSFFPNMDSEPFTKCLNAFKNSRLLRFDQETIELAHDSLAALVDGRRSAEQRHLQDLRRRILNSYEESKESGSFLNQKQIDSFEEFIPALTLNPEILDYIERSKQNIQKQIKEEEQRKQAAFRLEQKEKEIEHQKREAKLLEEKLAAEKKATQRRKGILWMIGVAAVITTILSIWAVGQKRIADRTLDVISELNRGDKIKINKLNKELDSLQIFISSIASASGDAQKLDSLTEKAQASIKQLKEENNKNNKLDTSTPEVEVGYASLNKETNIFQTTSNNYSTKKDTFLVNDRIYLMAKVDAPRKGEIIKIQLYFNNNEFSNPYQATIDGVNTDEGYRITTWKKPAMKGNFEARLYNGKDEQIGSTQFVIK